MDRNVEIVGDDEIVIIDADEIFNTSEINLDDVDLEAIKESEAEVAKATNSVAAAAKLQKRALEELENAEEARQSVIRKVAVKYDIPANKDWQINLSSGTIIMMPERD